MTVSCTNSRQQAGATANQDIATDSISIADSLKVGNNPAKVTIAGLYPRGGQGAVGDSIAAWLTKVMGNQISSLTGDKAPATAAPDGNALIKTWCDTTLAEMRSNLEDMAQYGFPDFTISNEADITFGPVYQSDKLITYYLTAYAYMGGAHGGTTANYATFDKADGVILTDDKVFKPESRPELIGRIREGLWKQYFAQDTSLHDMKEALLIDPDSLKLPATNPNFGPKGVTFTYQQYEIACYAAGMPSCTLTYDSLRPLMQTDVQSLLPD